MPKVSQSYLDARRTQILDAAILCFSRAGFHRTTMHEIIEQSQLSAGAIYNYFRSKEAIIEAIAKQRHVKERQLMIAAQKESTVVRALKRIENSFFGELRSPKEHLSRRVGIQMWAEALRNQRVRKLVLQGVDQPRKLLGAIISEGKRRKEVPSDLDSDAVARFMIAVFQGFVLQMEWDKDIALEPYLRVLDLFLRSVFRPA